MKTSSKKILKFAIQTLISILTAAMTALGTCSCTFLNTTQYGS
jgi:hypothetical protein